MELACAKIGAGIARIAYCDLAVTVRVTRFGGAFVFTSDGSLPQFERQRRGEKLAQGVSPGIRVFDLRTPEG